MAEPGAHLIALRRLDSQVKRDRVMAALAGYVERGEAMTIVGLARRAGVSPRFIYNHPDLRAEIERRAAEIGDQLAGAMVAVPGSRRRRSEPSWPTTRLRCSVKRPRSGC